MIDTHCHINFKAFAQDYNEVVQETLRQGIQMIIVGTDLKTSQKALEIAQEYSGVYVAVGMHPIHVQDRDWQAESNKIADLLGQKKVVAIGEVGFDKFRIQGDEKLVILEQKRVFDFFIDRALENKKPLIVHNRQALPELDKTLLQRGRELSQCGGVVHCYSGNLELAKRLFRLGFFVGFNGLVTYNPQWDKLIKTIPLDKILLETDAPFLTPEPKRGQRNEPKNVFIVAEYVAKLKKVKTEKILEKTDANARQLFNLD